MKKIGTFLLLLLCIKNATHAGDRSINDINRESYQSRYFEHYMGLWGGDRPVQERPLVNQNPFALNRLTSLETKLKDLFAGQDEAIEQVIKSLERSALGFKSNGPIESLLFVGPTGVGKTQMAKEIAQISFNNQSNFIKLNMASYASDSGLYRLIGVPPGYINAHLGGEFTELLKVVLKHNPYAVILLDEVDRASTDVLNIFAEVFEEGTITDALGNKINCHHCLFILTTNLTDQKISTLHNLGHTSEEITKEISLALSNFFGASFYNRLKTVVFTPFKNDVLDSLVDKLLISSLQELEKNLDVKLSYQKSLVGYFVENADCYTFGARSLKESIHKILGEVLIEAFKNQSLSTQNSAILSYANGLIYLDNQTSKEVFEYSIPKKIGQLTPPFDFSHILELEAALQKNVIGQESAIQLTVAALKRYAAGFMQANAPIGAFLYIGPSGVGKTELAKELSRQLLGSDSHLIRLDMSEYGESSTVSKLIGSAPGYINHEEGGQFTEAIKKHPYAIVLLDEIEKAHSVVRKMFLQVFDEGNITDSKGEKIDCKNIIFICTTNLGSQNILDFTESGYSDEEILNMIRYEVINELSPELYNRLEPVLFKGLTLDLMDQLVEKQLLELQQEIKKLKNIDVEFDESLKFYLRLNGFDYELGARPLKRLIRQEIVTLLATAIIANEISPNQRILISHKTGVVGFVKLY